jgi:hypothetical protein
VIAHEDEIHMLPLLTRKAVEYIDSRAKTAKEQESPNWKNKDTSRALVCVAPRQTSGMADTGFLSSCAGRKQ